MRKTIIIDPREIQGGHNPWGVNHQAIDATPFGQSTDMQKNYLENVVDTHPYIYPAILVPIANGFVGWPFFDLSKVNRALKDMVKENRVKFTECPEHIQFVAKRGAPRHIKTTKHATKKCSMNRIAFAMFEDKRADKHNMVIDEIFKKIPGQASSKNVQAALKEFDKMFKYCSQY